MLKSILSLLIVICLTGFVYSQNKIHNSSDSKEFSRTDLKERILSSGNSIDSHEKIILNTSPVKSKKSPALALALSVVLPGAGHYYLDRMDVGKFFLGTDLASWLGLVTLNIYGDAVRDDSRSYSNVHAEINNSGNKDDDFYRNIGSYNSVYDYNNDKLIRGEYNLLYSTTQNYWNWDNTDNRNFYESNRKKSERIYNNRIIFSSILIANRIVSGISALLLANKYNSGSNSVSINPELLYDKNLSLDGFKLNFNRNF
ncbi:MAG: hypothetical protein JSS91_13355 [Bacteroidetes bacterium]|nr:hypothetical protein [Bacteroidota bacterium]